MAGQDTTAHDIHVIEYAELKSEQRTRLTTRDNLGYATWAAIGLVLAAPRVTNQVPSHQWWLALPLVVGVLGWTRFQNDVKISGIGRYIRDELRPALSEHVGEPVFGWEVAHGGPGTHRQLRMVCQLAADLALYLAVPAAALTAFWSSPPPGWIWTAGSVAEALGIAVLATVITLHSGIRVRGRRAGAATTEQGTGDISC